jgi:hypothetical protein
VFGFDGSPTLTRLLRSLASRLWLWTRGPTLDADQCINVARYRCCRLQAAAVELLLAFFLLPFVDHRDLYQSFPKPQPGGWQNFPSDEMSLGNCRSMVYRKTSCFASAPSWEVSVAFGSLTCQVSILVPSVSSQWLVDARTG